MKNASVAEGRILADFNKGRLTAKQAAKMIKKLAAKKGKARRNWK